jgi:hypothetical protein
MDQGRVEILGSQRQVTNCNCVNGKTPIWVGFTIVDRMVHGAVDYDIGIVLAEFVDQSQSLSDVHVAATKGHEIHMAVPQNAH